MAGKFREFKEGDAFEPWIINLIFKELARWRKLSASGSIGVTNADNPDAPPTINDWRTDPLLPAVLTGALSAGSLSSPTSAGGTLLLVTAVGSTGYTATGGMAITVYNLSTSAVSSGKFCWVKPMNGNYYLISADC